MYFSEILFETQNLLFKKMHLEISSEKSQRSCLGLNKLTEICDELETDDPNDRHWSWKSPV